MNKNNLNKQPTDIRSNRKRIVCTEPQKRNYAFENLKLALKLSEQHLQKQLIEFELLNHEYLILNEELTESLQRIQKMNSDLISAKAKAEESDRLKSAFLDNILHEIRTPMNAIIGFSDLLENNDFWKSKNEQFNRIIKANCKQLLTVISDIIEISKLESDQSSIEKKEGTLNQLLREVYTTYAQQAMEKNINFIFFENPELANFKISTDLGKIKQILGIFINNALKFIEHGQITIGFNVKESLIEIYVSDTGIGISKRNQEFIFDHFRQVDPRKFAGNGLGLSIAKALVEKLGGKIAVKSRLRKGSTFSILLPCKQNLTDAAKNTESIDQQVNWADKAILLVEDEIFNHSLIEEILLNTHVKIFHAWNGEKAIEMVKSHPDISLVLMDIKMPIIDGYEAIRHIKHTNHKLPVIAITAYVFSHSRSEALKAGFDNYIPKPISKDKLVSIMADYLN